MAQKVVIELSDDLDGSEAAETVTFALDGRSYEIDLSEKNAAKIREIIAPYAEAGRRQAGSRRGLKRTPTASDRPNPVEVREWAATQGIEVAPRGRVSAEIVEKFLAAKSR